MRVELYAGWIKGTGNIAMYFEHETNLLQNKIYKLGGQRSGSDLLFPPFTPIISSDVRDFNKSQNYLGRLYIIHLNNEYEVQTNRNRILIKQAKKNNRPYYPVNAGLYFDNIFFHYIRL